MQIGWADNVKLARVKYRNAATGNVTGPSTLLIHRLALPAADLPQKYMEIVANFETDFWICGLAPFRSHLVAVSCNGLVCVCVRVFNRFGVAGLH